MICEGKSRRQGAPCPGANTSLFACGHEVERILPHSTPKKHKRKTESALDSTSYAILTCSPVCCFIQGINQYGEPYYYLLYFPNCVPPRVWIALDAGLR